MDMHSFDGRVAAITGAGRGIGRAYALLLASRGARVVVNDLGGSIRGLGSDAGVAATVAAEIAASGGSAIADQNDVAAPSGAQALIDAAVDNFGRLDILINNAGIIRVGGPAGRRPGERGAALRRARPRVVQHDTGGVAPHGRTGLRPHCDDDLLGDLRAAQEPVVRDRQGRRHRPDAQHRHHE